MPNWRALLLAFLMAAPAQPAFAAPDPLPAKAWRGRLGAASAYLPDADSPARFAFVNASPDALPPDDPRLRALARKYNALVLALKLDWREQDANARLILDALADGARRLPARPELAHLGVALFGFSASAAAAGRTAASPLLSNPDPERPPQRVLAVVGLDEIDRPPFSPPLSTPHLFLSDPGDFYGGLETNVQDYEPKITHDAYAKSRAAQGAPITVASQLGHFHGGAYHTFHNVADFSFMALWLDEVLSARLPPDAPTRGPALAPDWRGRGGWLAAYDVDGPQPPRAPFGGDDERVTRIVAAPRDSFKDERPFVWLPGERSARALAYNSEHGVTPPEPARPLAVTEAFFRPGPDLKSGKRDVRLGPPGAPSIACGDGALFVLFDRPVASARVEAGGVASAREAPQIWSHVAIARLAPRGPGLATIALRDVAPLDGGPKGDFSFTASCR
ncbi:hypothetical protein [Methylocella sp.]|uniref:hypothetical protein n=1 Tax=Methylocella sp. TaxID=1978226 RepID=UPI003784CD90